MQKTVHVIECQQPWFGYIAKGLKPVEGKKATPDKWAKIKAGDIIQFVEPVSGEKFLKTVSYVNWYPTLLEYLKGEVLDRCLPNISTYEEGLKIYHAWSTDEEIERYGFLGINVE